MRRVTLGEMLVPPRMVKFMDAVSNGLDASTTFDIFRSIKHVSRILGSTICVSLLQVPFPHIPLTNCSSLPQKCSIYLMN
jgi:ABC-type Mn2+/Zn2+ transport system ATPase subunit